MQAFVLVYAYQPLKLLSNTVAQIKTGVRNKIDGPTPAELEPLVDSFNQLLNAEADRRNKLRSALERLAHVLRTPLTVLQSRSYSDLDDQFAVREQTNRMLNIVELELKKVSASQGAGVGTREQSPLNQSWQESLAPTADYHDWMKLRLNLNLTLKY